MAGRRRERPGRLAEAGEWSDPYRYQGFVQERPCPDRYPRRVGIPAKRPLF